MSTEAGAILDGWCDASMRLTPRALTRFVEHHMTDDADWNEYRVAYTAAYDKRTKEMNP